MRYNGMGNWAPFGIPIYTLTLTKPIHRYEVGAEIEVVESQHPSFEGKWQSLGMEAIFFPKEYGTIENQKLMTNKEQWQKMYDKLTALEPDATKLDQKGAKASAKRLRMGYMEIAKSCKEYRKSIQDSIK